MTNDFLRARVAAWPCAALAAILFCAPLLAAGQLRVLICDPEGNPTITKEWPALLNQRNASAEAITRAPTAAQLEKADVLVLHAAEPKAIAGLDRAALESFAARGGGFVVLHGGVAAADGAWLKPLIGGAWENGSRKFNSRMTLYVTPAQHAIVHGASPFDLDDETYYDLDLDNDVTVLASAFTPKLSTREDRRHRAETASADRANIFDLQPQLWTFESRTAPAAKAHRAFVALQGAPATLQHISFRVFAFRGIAWAAGRDSIDELCSKQELASLMYPVGGPSVPEETVRQMDLHPGFKASVVAAEPLINKPIAIQWDASGRLWVAETPEYPNGRRPMVAPSWKETGVLVAGVTNRPATDRISILTDADAHGRFTKKTIFYEGLDLVTGFCFYKDGIIVLHEPDILWIRDTDGNGKADFVQRLYTGFTPGDTHFVGNHLILAQDGWVYASMGGGAVARNPDTDQVLGRISSGLFRFKPDGSAIEQVSSKGGNGFGSDVTSDMELFFGQATTGNPIQHVALPEPILARGNVGGTIGPNSVIEHRKIVVPKMPDRAALMQIDVVGGFSAACSSLCYEGGAWPDEWNRGLFCTEPILNIIHHERLKTTGVTFIGEKARDPEFLYCRDYWFRPIDVAPGPDGALYLLDFYTPVIAHNDTRGPLHSRSGASVRPDRNHYFGRIYRVQHEQAKHFDIPDLAHAGTPELLGALSHPNRLIRLHAQQQLVNRGGSQVIAPLKRIAQGAPSIPARLLALWALERLDALAPEMVRAALRAPEAEVRKNAVLIVEASPRAGAFASDVAALVNDADPRVRLDALRTLVTTGLDDRSPGLLVNVFPKLDDNWSRSAAVAAASGNAVAAVSAAFASSAPGDLRPFVSALAAQLVEKQNPAAFGELVHAAAGAPEAADELKQVVLEAAGKLTTAPTASPQLIAALRSLLGSSRAAIAAATLPLAARWDTGGELKGEVSRQVESLLAQLSDSHVPDSRREQVAVAVIGARAANPSVLPSIANVLAQPNSDGLKRAIISRLGSTGDPAVGPLLVHAFTALSTPAQSAAFDVLAARTEWMAAFLDAVDQKQIALSLLGPANIFRLRTHPSAEISRRANAMLQNALKGSADKDALIAKFTPLVTQPGDATKGKELFTANCAVCHKFGELGNEVGPILTGMGVHGPENLLIHILDPNRQVDGGYETWNIETTDGEVQSGIIAQENEARVVLRMPNQQLEIPTAKIKSRVDTRRSLMPEGFEALGGDGLRDIITFLTGDNSRFRVLNLAGAFTADTRRGLYHAEDALYDTWHFRKYGLVSVEGIPFNLVNPANSPLGGNVIVLKGGGRGEFAFTFPQRVEVPVGYPASRLHFLGGVAGWGGSARPNGPMVMRVTMVFADGQRSEIDLHQGDVFVDWISRVEAPGSKYAEGVVLDHQVRWFTIPVPRKAPLAKLILESAGSGPAPATLAITADLSDAPLPSQPVATLASTGPVILPAAAVAAAPASADASKPFPWGDGLKVLVVGGGSSHDFKKWFNEADVATLRAAGKLSVNYTDSPAATAAALGDVDVLVSSTNQRGFDTPELREALFKFVGAGKGLVLLHPGVWYNWPWPEYNRQLAAGGARSHDRIGEFEVKVLKEHPVTKGLPATFKATDELYQVNIDPAGPPVEILAQTSTSIGTKKEHPSIWIVQHPKARIVCIALGHDGRVHELPEYKQLLVNAVRWVGKQ